MKIKLLIILLISLNTYSSVWAACLIKDKPAPALSEYIKDNRTVITNISNSIVNEKNKKDDENRNIKNTSSRYEQLKKKTSDDFDNASAETASIFNEIFNFSWYYSYFKYFVTYPILNEVPFQVKRDYSMLDNENKWLVNYLKTLDKNWDSWTQISNPCKWVINWNERCKEKLDNKTAKKIIWLLIQNNDLILDLYRNSIIWSDKEYTKEKFILVNDWFINEIKWKYYSQKNVWDCNSEKWWFFKKIITTISDIKLINKKWSDWIKKWQDAIALLLWNAPDWEEEKAEQQQLKDYLSDSWIPTDKQAIIMKNLKNSKSNTFSLNNNFLVNTYSTTIKNIKKDIALWKKQNIWDALPKETKKMSTNTLEKILPNADISRNIEKTIDELYENELPYIWVWNITTETLRSKMITSHLNIQNSIKTLNDTIIISQKVCKKQWGWWLCN